MEEGAGGGGQGGGNKPQLRVYIPGQKEFVPRTVSVLACTVSSQTMMSVKEREREKGGGDVLHMLPGCKL